MNINKKRVQRNRTRGISCIDKWKKNGNLFAISFHRTSVSQSKPIIAWNQVWNPTNKSNNEILQYLCNFFPRFTLRELIHEICGKKIMRAFIVKKNSITITTFGKRELIIKIDCAIYRRYRFRIVVILNKP